MPLDVHPLHEVFGQPHVVVAEEDHMLARIRAPDKLYPSPYESLPILVRGMSLPGKDQLHGMLGIGQQAKQPLGVVQQHVRPLVGREPPRKAQRQSIGIQQMFRPVNFLLRGAGGSQLPGRSFAGVFNKSLPGGGAKLPEPGVRDAANVLVQGLGGSQPAVFTAGLRPKVVGCR